MLIPSKIRISASTICQLECVLCDSFGRKPKVSPSDIGSGFLKFRHFKKLLDLNPHIKFVELSWKGEIFLNPEIEDIIKYAYEKGVELSADGGVNLNDVSPKVIESLVKYCFKNIRVSIDGASSQTYKIYRKNGNFDKVLKNILLINKFKKKYNSGFPDLCWQFVVFGHNEHEIPAARKIASMLGMRFKTKLSWDPNYSPVRNKDFVKKETSLDVVNRQEFLNKFGCDYNSDTCKQLILSPLINYDGRLFGCCENSRIAFGNVFKDGLIKCLNTDNYRHTVKVALNNLDSCQGTPCENCRVYKNNKSKQTIKRGRREKQDY